MVTSTIVDLSLLYQQIDECQYEFLRRGRSVMESIQLFEGCCQPVGAGVLGEDDAEDLATMFKALADPARLRLLSMVASSSGEVCACDLVGPSGKSQPTVSHHLSLLVEAGLLAREKRGRWAWYSVVPERLAGLRNALSE
jgi:ArsR family transcriptional regulator